MRFLLILFVFISFQTNAQNWSVLSVPDSLKTDADAVKRFEELRIIIKDVGHAVIKHRVVKTILNEAGEKFSGYANFYDNFNSLSDISGTLYDADGKKLKSVKKKDIGDQSYADGMSIANDTRIKHHNFYYRVYPYTEEYEDEVEMKGIFQLPKFNPVDGFKMSVEKTHVTLVAPADYKFETKLLNCTLAPSVSDENGKRSYTWSVNNITAKTYQSFQPAFAEITPTVVIKPIEFEMGGYKGNMQSWKSLGQFVQQLNYGKDALPDVTKAAVHSIADQLTDRTEKIKALYNYLQQNSRYILVALGMGGWQPFDAAYVAKNKFGDCKALSNFMVSMLKEVGITAYYALIRSGDNEPAVWEDFPVPYFNHATVCVPNGTDSVWLECTSQTESAGFQGSFTGGRKALLITEEGGKLVSTKQYTAADNLLARKVSAELNTEGTLKIVSTTLFKGIQQERLHELIHFSTEDEKKKYLNEAINLPTYEVVESNYEERKGYLPEVKERLVINAPMFADVTRSRLFITPNLFNKSNLKLVPDEKRSLPVVLDEDYADFDTVNIVIPAGYVLESKPKDVSIESEFGKYSIKFFVNENRIGVIRKDEMYKKTFPPSAYNSLADYASKIYKADRGQLVFKKQ